MAVTILAGCSLEVTVPDLGVRPDQAPASESGVDTTPSDGPGLDATLDGPGLDVVMDGPGLDVVMDGPTPDLATDLLAPDGKKPPPFTIDVVPTSSTVTDCATGTLVGGGTHCLAGSIRHSWPAGNTWTSSCTGGTQNLVTVAVCVTGLTISKKNGTFVAGAGVLSPCHSSGEAPVGGGCKCGYTMMVKTFPTPLGWFCGCDGQPNPFGSVVAYCSDPAQVTVTPVNGPNSTLTSTAECPPDKILIGGGCNSTHIPPQPLTRSSPDMSGKPVTKFICQATLGTVQATALCVNDPTKP